MTCCVDGFAHPLTQPYDHWVSYQSNLVEDNAREPLSTDGPLLRYSFSRTATSENTAQVVSTNLSHSPFEWRVKQQTLPWVGAVSAIVGHLPMTQTVTLVASAHTGCSVNQELQVCDSACSAP